MDGLTVSAPRFNEVKGKHCQLVEDDEFAAMVEDWNKKVVELVLRHIPPVLDNESMRIAASYYCHTEFYIDVKNPEGKKIIEDPQRDIYQREVFLPCKALHAVIKVDPWLTKSFSIFARRDFENCPAYYGPHCFPILQQGPAVRTDDGVPWYYVRRPRTDTTRSPHASATKSQRPPFVLPMPADALGLLDHKELQRTTVGDLFLKYVVPYGGNTLLLTRGHIQGYHSYNLRSWKKRKLVIL